MGVWRKAVGGGEESSAEWSLRGMRQMSADPRCAQDAPSPVGPGAYARPGSKCLAGEAACGRKQGWESRLVWWWRVPFGALNPTCEAAPANAAALSCAPSRLLSLVLPLSLPLSLSLSVLQGLSLVHAPSASAAEQEADLLCRRPDALRPGLSQVPTPLLSPTPTPVPAAAPTTALTPAPLAWICPLRLRPLTSGRWSLRGRLAVLLATPRPRRMPRAAGLLAAEAWGEARAAAAESLW